MDFPAPEPTNAVFEDTFQRAANGLADSMLKGLSRGVSEALADPIVQALMAADGVDRDCVEAMLRRVTAKLAGRGPYVQSRCSW
jgi:hypothetical protein